VWILLVVVFDDCGNRGRHCLPAGRCPASV